MRTMLKGGLLFVVVLLGILLVSNLDKGVTTESPNELRLILEPPQTMQQVAEKYPELQVDEETNTITVPESKTEAYTKKLVDNHDAKQVMRVESTPAFHFDRYWKAVSDKVTGYFEGDLGRITYQSSNAQSYSLNAMLVQMVIRSLTYLLPGLLVGVLGGYLFALLAVFWPPVGKVLDVLKTIILSMPDFFVVVLLQMGAILIDRATGHPTVIVVQFGDDVPFLVPLLAISVLPATLIYGTLRLAVEREWTEGYIKTAASKGLARMPIFFTHILRNTMEDLLTILPRGVTVAVTSMAVAEVMCFIFGLGGYAISPSVVHVTTLTTTCGILAVITMLLHLVLALVRKRFVVNTSEGGA